MTEPNKPANRLTKNDSRIVELLQTFWDLGAELKRVEKEFLKRESVILDLKKELSQVREQWTWHSPLWTEVGDRLPDEPGWYLCFNGNIETMMFYKGEFQYDEFWNEEPTHWTTLPEKPDA